MQDLEEIAIKAIECRRVRNYNFGEFVAELERKCSPEEVRRLLEWAEHVVPHPERPRALRILRSAAKAARRRDPDRKNRLYAEACKLIGEDEVFVLIEENRLSFTPGPVFAEAPRRPRCGFVA